MEQDNSDQKTNELSQKARDLEEENPRRSIFVFSFFKWLSRWKDQTISFLLMATLASVLLSFQNCGVQQPKVENMSSMAVGVSHDPIPVTCIDCHLSERPKVAVSASPDGKSNLFVHDIPEYGGDQDCVNCHTQATANVGRSWQGGVFNHKNSAAVPVSKCLTCHLGNKPVGTSATNSYDHANIGSKDCFECHKNAGANWSSSAFSHTPTPQSCSSCHASDRPAATVYFPYDSSKPKLNLYVHATEFNGSSDCVNCHVKVPENAGVKWSGGYYNHLTNTGSKVAKCVNCHLGSKPVGTSATNSYDHANIGTQDCYACHKNAGATWSGTYSHIPVPTSCNSCHSSDRPSGTTYYPSLPSKPTLNLYVHATQYNGGADCATCHLQVPMNAGSTWAGAYYNHTTNTGAMVTNCTNCHKGNMPIGVTATMTFNHANVGTKDCYECHKGAGATWSTANFSHQPVPVSCNACHTSDRPPATIYFPYDATQPTKNLYAHASQFNGTGDCYKCHTKVAANIGTSWKGGFYDHKTSSGTKVATCLECHEGSRPSTHITKGYTGNCVSCHVDAGVSWKASGATVPSSVTYLTPTGTSWPSITAAHPNATSQSGMTCATCHVNYNTTKSIKQFDHGAIPTNTKCYLCHVTNQQVVDTSAVTLKMVSASHGGTGPNKDCNACHSVTYPTWNSTTKTFTGGKW